MKNTLFVICLAIISSTMTQRVYGQSDSQAMGAFTKADQNGDKTLSKAELRVFIKAMADMGHSESKRAVRFGSIGYGVAWRRADRDKSGTVTFEELQSIR